MEPVETLSRIEECYREVLRLTEEQEVRLRDGDLAAVAHLVKEKSRSVARAQELLAALKGAGDRPAGPGFQEALGRVAVVMAKAVEVEDRCRALAPAPSPAPASRRQAAAAYASASRGGAGNR